MPSSKRRPDGRRRFSKDKGLISLMLAGGADPAEPALRTRLVSQLLGLGLPLPVAESRADDTLEDLRWGQAGFPTV